jgi:hypothetical protein
MAIVPPTELPTVIKWTPDRIPMVVSFLQLFGYPKLGVTGMRRVGFGGYSQYFSREQWMHVFGLVMHCSMEIIKLFSIISAVPSQQGPAFPGAEDGQNPKAVTADVRSNGMNGVDI